MENLYKYIKGEMIEYGWRKCDELEKLTLSCLHNEEIDFGEYRETMRGIEKIRLFLLRWKNGKK